MPGGSYLPSHIETRRLRLASEMAEEPRTEFLQIRLTPEERARIQRVAEAEHLEMSTWARRELLKAIERWEEEQDD